VFVSGAETMEGERATAGEVVARPQQEQGRGGWSPTLGATRENGVAAWRYVQQREGGQGKEERGSASKLLEPKERVLAAVRK
jgi:hypothetical protein